MIYVGYQGIGKSSIAGKNNCVDLESNNFRIDGRRDPNWYRVYCNIAEQLSNQGYNVFISSHKLVRDELTKKGIDFITIVPNLQLEEQWLKRLQDRYDRTQLDKDYRALMGAKVSYKQNIEELINEKHVIVINSIDYDLNDLIKM